MNVLASIKRGVLILRAPSRFAPNRSPPASRPRRGSVPAALLILLVALASAAFAETRGERAADSNRSAEPAWDGNASIPRRTATNDGPPAPGTLEVLITAGPRSDVQHVTLGIERLEFRAGTGPWIMLTEDPKDVDLLELNGGRYERVAIDEFPAATYTEARITFGELWLNPDGTSLVMASWPNGHVKTVSISGGGIVVQSGSRSTVTFDVNSGQSLQHPQGGGWTMQPVISTFANVVQPIHKIAPSQLAELGVLGQQSSVGVERRFSAAFNVPERLAGSWPSDPQAPDAAERAVRFANAHRALWRMNPARDAFVVKSTRPSRQDATLVHLTQRHDGVPVQGASLIVRVNSTGAHITRVAGTAVPDLGLGVTPSITGTAAQTTAEADIHTRFPQATITHTDPAALVVFHPRVFNRMTSGNAILAWRVTMRTTNPAALWRTFVDATTGNIARSDDLIEHAFNAEVYDGQFTSSTSDDDFWFEDGTKIKSGTAPADVDDLNTFMESYYDYMLATFSHNSLDDAGMKMVGRALAATPNAAWDPTDEETAFNANWVTLDVVGHEFTHGMLDEATAGLDYVSESGAINEHLADSFGEFLDCQTSCNFLVGEDALGNNVPSGPIRSMIDPAAHSQPDNWNDFDPGADVHTGSGIGNKVVQLMAQGGTHYGVTVSSLGVSRTEQILYSTLIDVGLSTTASYYEYRDAMLDACEGLIGTHSITSTSCTNVWRAWCSVGLCALTQQGIGASNEDNDQFGRALATGDFNGDGYQDLAVGSPYENIDATNDGAVFVFYGSAVGLSATEGNEIIDQSELGAANENSDHFGWSLAAGDFNGDGKDDLAVGIPDDNIESDSATDAGWVAVINGTSNGLVSGGVITSTSLRQDHAGAANESGDHFGYSLAAGDFDADGYDDIAIGAPKEDIESESATNAGAVFVFFGASGGVRSGGGDDILTESDGSANVETGDYFGFSLAAGDLDGDGYDDLAIGAPYEDLESPSVNDAGFVMVFYGSSSNLGGGGVERFTQDDAGHANEWDDYYGWSLAIGDFNGDQFGDLAVGIPYENSGTKVDCGWVDVYYGSSAGLESSSGATNVESFGEPSAGASSEWFDKFGMSLAAGDSDGDGYDDLLIGAPYEDFESSSDSNTGWVALFLGSSSGLLPASADGKGQGSFGGVNEDGDHFGWALAFGDFNGDGNDDYAVSAPDENFSEAGVSDGGAVYIHDW